MVELRAHNVATGHEVIHVFTALERRLTSPADDMLCRRWFAG